MSPPKTKEACLGFRGRLCYIIFLYGCTDFAAHRRDDSARGRALGRKIPSACRRLRIPSSHFMAICTQCRSFKRHVAYLPATGWQPAGSERGCEYTHVGSSCVLYVVCVCSVSLCVCVCAFGLCTITCVCACVFVCVCLCVRSCSHMSMHSHTDTDARAKHSSFVIHVFICL